MCAASVPSGEEAEKVEPVGEGRGGEGRGWSEGSRVEIDDFRRTRVPVSAAVGAVGERGAPLGQVAGLAIWRESWGREVEGVGCDEW